MTNDELISWLHKEIGFALARENGERAQAFLDVLEKIKPITANQQNDKEENPNTSKEGRS